MEEQIAELKFASRLLRVALDQYLQACAAIQTCHNQAAIGAPRELLDCIVNEASFAATHVANMRQAQSIIYQTRNYSPALTPIHSLPAEILIQVFYLVIRSSYTTKRSIEGTELLHTDTSLPKYPDHLSHVCSPWRQILLGLPAVWSRIDLTDAHTLSPGHLARGRVCVERSGSLPLDIYIRLPSSHGVQVNLPLGEFLSSIRHRMRSLDLSVPGSAVATSSGHTYDSCFYGSTPGILTQLTIVDRGQYSPSSMSGNEAFGDGPEPTDSYRIEQDQDYIERILRGVTILRLDGLYPYWDSQAYCDLEELRLGSYSRNSQTIVINNCELHQISLSSPKLRVLQFSIHVVYSARAHKIAPIPLRNLEILDLSGLTLNDLQIFFGVLAPGPNPLELTLKRDASLLELGASNDLATQFLSQSNFTKIYINYVSLLESLFEIYQNPIGYGDQIKAILTRYCPVVEKVYADGAPVETRNQDTCEGRNTANLTDDEFAMFM